MQRDSGRALLNAGGGRFLTRYDIATIKLKETTASDLFRRLNSYSKQHGLYQALKAFGQMLKSDFILPVIDEPTLRMAIERIC